MDFSPKKRIEEFKSMLLIKDKKAFARKTIICFLGVFGMGFFLSFLIMCGLGTDPYTFMNRSLAARVGWTLGNWQFLFNAVLLLFVIAANLRLIGMGTIFNMILIGYYADFFCWLWRRVIPAKIFAQDPVRAVVFAVTLICFIISAAVYMNAQSGLSPYDATGKIIADKLSKLPFFLVRICYDFLAIGVGMLAGGKPTIGIILMAIGLGPAITLVGRQMEKIL